MDTVTALLAPSTERSDADLLQLVARAHLPALRELYERHAGALLVLARVTARHHRDRVDPEQLVVDVFTSVWFAPPSIEDPDAVKGHLVRLLGRLAHGTTWAFA